MSDGDSATTLSRHTWVACGCSFVAVSLSLANVLNNILYASGVPLHTFAISETSWF